jgi:hypothetical protein
MADNRLEIETGGTRQSVGRTVWVLLILVTSLAACNREPTDSAAILPPESPAFGTVVDVLPEEHGGRFVLETRQGERIAFPIQDVALSSLERYQRSREVVAVVSEVRNGELRVVTIEANQPTPASSG